MGWVYRSNRPLAPQGSTSPLDDTWISSIVGLSGSVKLFSVKLFLLAPLWWGILCYVLLRLANPYLKEHGVKLLQINNRKYKALIKIFKSLHWICDDFFEELWFGWKRMSQ